MPTRRSSTDPAPTLDELDRGIVRVLQKNGRTTNTVMAKELQVTETTIRNRVARLLSEGLIEIVAVPTPRAVGLTLSAIVGISVQLCEIDQVSEQLVKCSETRYVGLSTGRHDIIIEAFFQNEEHLFDFLTRRIGSFSGVTDVETSIILKVPKFSYEWEVPL